jgi:nucleotide-binding universal stress UspA family protein
MAYSNILIAVDGSKYSQHAVKKGIELAEQLSATVTLLCVVDYINVVADLSGEAGNQEVFKILGDEANEIVDSTAKKYSYNKIKKLTAEGIPAKVILKTAKDIQANIIITGTHGRKGLSHLFLGSVAEYVVRYSEIPVMVIPIK